mmetsp:Transcript_33169/g.130607  ORF Transcript_33169/g.130607 Transcript_33169/m.130607 type:complete len:88 (+) Transcript_33169:2580-2843(+)
MEGREFEASVQILWRTGKELLLGIDSPCFIAEGFKKPRISQAPGSLPPQLGIEKAPSSEQLPRPASASNNLFIDTRHHSVLSTNSNL